MDDDVFEAKVSISIDEILRRTLWRESFDNMPVLPEFKEYMEARISAAQ
jgi:hypothetical protein